jgi:hypothetical protein
MLLLIGVWVYFMRQMQGGGKGGAFSFGKSKARMMDENGQRSQPWEANAVLRDALVRSAIAVDWTQKRAASLRTPP